MTRELLIALAMLLVFPVAWGFVCWGMAGGTVFRDAVKEYGRYVPFAVLALPVLRTAIDLFANRSWRGKALDGLVLAVAAAAVFLNLLLWF